MMIFLTITVIVTILTTAFFAIKSSKLKMAIKDEAAKNEKLKTEAEKNVEELKETISKQAIELAEYRRLGRNADEASRNVKQIEALVDGTSNELDRIKQDIASRRSELAEIEAKSKELAAENEKLEAKNEQLLNEKSGLEDERKAVYDRLRKAQGLEKSSSEISQSASALSERIARIDVIKNDIERDYKISEELHKILITKDRDYAMRLQGILGSFRGALIGLDENGLISEAFIFYYAQNSGPTVRTIYNNCEFRNYSYAEEQLKKLEAILTDETFATWVIIGDIDKDLNVSKLLKTEKIRAELSDQTLLLYCGIGHKVGRHIALNEKSKALETKRAELVEELDSLNVEASAMIGIDAILAN